MNLQKLKIYIYCSIMLCFLFLTINYNPFIQANTVHVDTTSNPPLKDMIKQHADEYHIKPKDAYIDRVWKKTPGRNGRKVNVEKSYNKMKELGIFNPSLVVFDDLPPKVSLKDLPAAPIYRGHPDKNMVAIMINVSWGTEYIPAILKTLKNEHVKATFYVEGKWAKENKEYVEMMQEEEHVIGNHAYNHPNMAQISQEEMHMQIDKTNEVLEAITGKKPIWFAPPSGSFNQQVVETASKLDMETILWTVDTIDWKNPSVSVMINRVMDNIHPGATILMHPTEVIAEGLESLIIQLKEEEYDLGTIDQLLNEKRG